MKSLITAGLLSAALFIAPLSAQAGYCGSGNKTYQHKPYHQGHKGKHTMMQYGYYQSGYRMPPPPAMPMPPAPPPVPQYWQPQFYPMMPMQPYYGYPYGSMMSQPQTVPPQQYGNAPTTTKPATMNKADAQQAAPAASVKQDETSTKAAQVTIAGMQFQPATLKIKAGETVAWTNTSSMPHTVTSSQGNELASSQLGNGNTFSHLFKKPGTYDYYCAIHPSMKGQVIVE